MMFRGHQGSLVNPPSFRLRPQRISQLPLPTPCKDKREQEVEKSSQEWQLTFQSSPLLKMGKGDPGLLVPRQLIETNINPL